MAIAGAINSCQVLNSDPERLESEMRIAYSAFKKLALTKTIASKKRLNGRIIGGFHSV
ncbi:hypothetical protein [Vreelandella zhaodongensis]|uniref:hypothetical protein n=1 Tax=Vreelandella zhaodongensis TaxID=1176240 RepID=UPI003EBC62D5